MEISKFGAQQSLTLKTVAVPMPTNKNGNRVHIFKVFLLTAQQVTVPN